MITMLSNYCKNMQVMYIFMKAKKYKSKKIHMPYVIYITETLKPVSNYNNFQSNYILTTIKQHCNKSW